MSNWLVCENYRRPIILGHTRKCFTSPTLSRKNYLFTKGERAYYDVLSKAIPEGYLIFTKVRLADLVFLPKGTQRRMHFFNRVSSKHVDFVICDTQMVGPKLVIELDDRSHQRSDRVARDAFVDEVLRKANIPILHVKAAQAYQQQQVASAVSASLLRPI